VKVDKLTKKLAALESELEDAKTLVERQDDTISNIQQEYFEKQKGFEERESALHQDKKDLEEHMVSVVVQQVHDAKAKERVAVIDECEAEFDAKIKEMEKDHMERTSMLESKVAEHESKACGLGNKVAELESQIATVLAALEVCSPTVQSTLSSTSRPPVAIH
jgi:chromosome segregation ATPase